MKTLFIIMGGVVLSLMAVPPLSRAGERPQLQILSADADVDLGTLVIQGRYLSWPSDSGTIVTLNGMNLIVTSVSETEIEAELPAFSEYGSYLLTVSRGNGLLQNDELLINVGVTHTCPCYTTKLILDAWAFVNSLYAYDPNFELEKSCFIDEDTGGNINLIVKKPYDPPDPTYFNVYADMHFAVHVPFSGDMTCAIKSAALDTVFVNPGWLIYSAYPTHSIISEGECNACVQALKAAAQQLSVICQ